MNLLEFDLTLPGRLQHLSADLPRVAWEVWPLGPRWLVRCEGPVEDLHALSTHPAILNRREIGAEPTASFLYRPSRPELRWLADTARWGAVVLPPIRWKSGRTALRLVAAEGASPTGWSARYGGVRLVQKHRAGPQELMDRLDRPAGVAPPLTLRQREVLLEAVRLGYYRVPRRATVLDVARRLHIARSTAEEHLRAAESTMIRSAAPLLAARDRIGASAESAPDASSLELYARYCAELDLYVQMALRDDTIYRVTFRRERPQGTRRGTHPYLQRILDHVENGTGGLEDLPVELEVGPFTRRVLEEVRRIPSGSTRTYGEIAQRLGEPRAARAVGNALAENPALVVVPCHRVVPSRGGVGEYSGAGGHRTKVRLLRKEGAIDEPSSS